MQVAIIFTLLFASAVASASESSVPVSGQPQHVPVVSGSPVVQPIGSNVEVPPQVGVEQPPHHPVSYYSPAGLITVEQSGANKPGSQVVRNFEQYGQPESASIPANYKPFGSWGLYIGGNPADGYYTNYYKALSNSVEKQQSGEGVKPVGSQTAAFSPFLKQASSSPYVGGDYYPFAYSPSDLSSAGRMAVDPVHSPVVHSPAQVYGSQPVVDPSSGLLSYADSYATKKLGAVYAQKQEATKEGPQPVAPPKGYQSRLYAYPSPAVYPMASAVGVQQASHQVVAYPVPVGSQIVGSQPGVEGSFSPYGIHAFTRYAVKPTVMSHEPSYYYSVHNPVQYPSYKQQVQPSSAQAGVPSSNYPLSFYGYPLSQLQNMIPSQGSQVVPESVHGEQGVHHGPVAQPPQVEAASEKSERNENKPVNVVSQKRA